MRTPSTGSGRRRSSCPGRGTPAILSTLQRPGDSPTFEVRYFCVKVGLRQWSVSCGAECRDSQSLGCAVERERRNMTRENHAGTTYTRFIETGITDNLKLQYTWRHYQAQTSSFTSSSFSFFSPFSISLSSISSVSLSSTSSSLSSSLTNLLRLTISPSSVTVSPF